MATETGKPKATRREIGAWASYDFANSAFTTLIVTFIFNKYYAEVIVGDSVHGGVLWTRAVTASALLVALITPVLGAVADYSGRKKRLLLAATLLCVLGTTGLFWMKSGDVLLAALVFIFANVAYEVTQALYNSFLPEIATRKNIGRISGLGWGVGYIGGLICLAIALGMVRLWLPDHADVPVRARARDAALGSRHRIRAYRLWTGRRDLPSAARIP
jgi:UMF1 family MFS transporter